MRDVPGFPVALLSEAFKPSEWQRLENLPYTGYVILHGKVGDDGTISRLRVTSAQPDRSRNLLAMGFCSELRVPATRIGSHVPPSATVHVIFYETPPIRTALVFGLADETIAPTGVQGGIRQLLIKSY